MEKSACVHLLILIWTILACLVLESSAGGRGAGWNKIEEPEEKKSILCYKCNSANDPNCGDPFDPYTLGVVNCSLVPVPEHLDPNITSTICRKTILKVYGKIRIVRDCGYIKDKYLDKECVKRSGTHDVQSFYCSCSESLCNGAVNNNNIKGIQPIILSSLFTVYAMINAITTSNFAFIS